MGYNISGYTKKTRENLTLNSGVVFRDFIVGEDTVASARAAGKLIGATQGGTKFTATMETNNLEIDNADPIINKTGTTCTLTTNFVDFSPETIAMAMGTGVIEDFNDDYYALKAKRIIDDNDYFDNICILTSRSGTNVPMIIEMRNVIVTSGVDINSQSDQITVLPVTFTANMPANDIDEYTDEYEFDPYTIYMPKSIDVIKFDVVFSGDTVVTGTGVEGAVVTIKGGTIPAYTTGIVENGIFSIDIPPQKAGTRLTGTQTLKNRTSYPKRTYVKAKGIE